MLFTTCQPFIGITDFKSADEQQSMSIFFHKYIKEKQIPHVFHIGVMAQPLHTYTEDHSWEFLFPHPETIASIFTDPYCMNCIHFVDHSTPSPNETFTTIKELLDTSGPLVNALQLNMVWPDILAVQDAVDATLSKKRFRPITLLEINQKAIENAGNTCQGVLERLEPYRNNISHVVINKNGIHEKQFDAHEHIHLVDEIARRFPSIGIVLHGGIGPETVNHILPLIKKYPHLSINAQQLLHYKKDSFKKICLEYAQLYIAKAYALFAQTSLPAP